MLLVIYPVIAICIFAVSTHGLYRLAVRMGRDKERTTLQRALQLAMMCCLALHLLAMLVLLATAYSAEHLGKAEISSSRFTLHFDYLSQYMLRCTAILCLNVGVFIISGMDPLETPNIIPEQAAVYTYVAMRTAGALLFHLWLNTDLQVKVIFIETFLASEAIVACLLFVALSGKVGRMKGKLEESFITERFFVEPVFDTAAGSSVIFAGCFLLNGLLRIGAIVVSINPPSPLMAVARDAINVLKVVNHALFIQVIIVFLFIDVQIEDDDLLHRVLLKLESLRRDGLRFFKFTEPARAEPEADSSEL